MSDGVHPKVVQERLGHSSIQLMMDTYSHVVPGMQERATERLEALLSHSRMDRHSNDLTYPQLSLPGRLAIE
jgi:hypothetical protein